jgi:hypothetical protein
MGQKVNPKIFRLAKFNNKWKFKYIENKTNELSAILLKSLEIKNFIKQLMLKKGFVLHNYNIEMLSTSLHLFISYYKIKHFNNIKNKKKRLDKKQKKVKFKNNKKSFKKQKKIKKFLINISKIYLAYIKKKKLYNNKTLKTKYKLLKNLKKRYSFINIFKKSRKEFIFIKKSVLLSRKNKFKKLKKNYTINKILKKKTNNFLFVKKKHKLKYFKKHYLRIKKRSLIIKEHKTLKMKPKFTGRNYNYNNIINYKNFKNLEEHSFGTILLENLQQFTDKKYSIYITLNNLSTNNFKSINYKKNNYRFIKETLQTKLYKYRLSKFFHLSKKIIWITAYKKNSAELLSNFISSQLNKLGKQQYYFLKFLKNIFKLLIKKTKLKGIKIIVKGRLKKASRAKNKTFKLLLGKMPLQNLKLEIDYATSTSYTPSGTFGISVWLNYSH